ncbi:MAG: helix-turn-helix domain-containing protein [Lentisphaeria bacterium]|nr:helix-turn-helix domain-containing protein [Lentisphaeria bacterium]NQZ69911.1 helix-turn-helix domain-containing protein [Lentisphaeria bacterium]
MARPKNDQLKELSDHAWEDLGKLDQAALCIKLIAIIQAEQEQIEKIAEQFDTSPRTVYRWIKNYKDEGLEGLTGGITGARESKLSPSQKELLKSWVTEKTDPMGKPTAWTLEKLKLVIKEQFNVDMSIMPLWTLLKNMNCQTENSHSNDSVSVAAS